MSNGLIPFLSIRATKVAFIGNSYVCYILAQFHSVPLCALQPPWYSGVSHLLLEACAYLPIFICNAIEALPIYPYVHKLLFRGVSTERIVFWACVWVESSPKSVSSFFASLVCERDRPAAVCGVHEKKILRYHFGHYRCSPHIWLTLE